MNYLRNKNIFIILYLLFVTPTYILPYFGSNSTVANSVSIYVGAGPTPLWWLHLFFLILLVNVSWIRGNLIKKPVLVIFPLAVIFFDLVPIFNSIPMVPTLLHVACILFGFIYEDGGHGFQNYRLQLTLMACLAFVPIVGGGYFFSAMGSKKTNEKVSSGQSADKKSSDVESTNTRKNESINSDEKYRIKTDAEIQQNYVNKKDKEVKSTSKDSANKSSDKKTPPPHSNVRFIQMDD